jgi:hypothetical protein
MEMVIGSTIYVSLGLFKLIHIAARRSGITPVKRRLIIVKLQV